jgi:hypothetical protein
MRGRAPAAVILFALVAVPTALAVSGGLGVRLAPPPDSAELGAPFDVAFSVQNPDTTDAGGATVDIAAPDGTKRLGVQGDLTCTGDQTVHCTVGAVPAGMTQTYAVTLESARAGQGTLAVTVRAGGSTAKAESTFSVYLLALRDLRTSPAKAGQSFTASQTLVRSDTSKALQPKSADCLAVIARTPKGSGLSLRGRSTLQGARITCSWQLPKGTSGKYVRAMIVASTRPGGVQTKQPFWRKIS